MIHRISFTTFMRFVTATGPAKLSKVRAALEMYSVEDYRLADFYLDLKHSLRRCFEGKGVQALDDCLDQLSDPRKDPHYRAAVAGVRKWIGRKKITNPFLVPAKDWQSGNLVVSVRPEYGIVVGGKPHVIKVLLNDEKVDQFRLNPLLHVLDQTHGSLGTVGILVARQSKLYTVTKRVRNMDAFLEGEAQSFVAMWDRLAA